MDPRVLTRFTLTVVTLIVLATTAQAGPPLICHVIEIGPAKSLPDVHWNSPSNGYDVKRLTTDTLEILDAKTSVLVRMETLRRAAIYARLDSQVAKELLTRLHARATQADATQHPDALAWFDAGYLAETYKQWLGKATANPANGLDGYGWVKKAIRLRGDDPEMEFAAALIAITGPENERRDHARKAIAGADKDPLLARNLASDFDRQTLASLLISTKEVK